MKTFLLLYIMLGAAFTAYSQDTAMNISVYQQRSDSILATRVIAKMQSLFTLNDTEQEEVKQATFMLSRQRRDKFMAFRSSPDLQARMEEQDKVQDSVYQSTIGTVKYAMFKKALAEEVAQKQAAMEARIAQVEQAARSTAPAEKSSEEDEFDSSVARALAGKMKDSLSLSAEQAEQIFQVIKTGRVVRREIWSIYQGGPVLQSRMEQEDRKQDSLYNTILGEEKYRLYQAKRIPLSIIN